MKHVNDTLVHHGVKGQKWGVRRRSRKKGNRRSKTKFKKRLKKAAGVVAKWTPKVFPVVATAISIGSMPITAPVVLTMASTGAYFVDSVLSSMPDKK